MGKWIIKNWCFIQIKAIYTSWKTVYFMETFISQRDATTFSYTFYGKGYATKQSDPKVPHEDEPQKAIVTKVTGPGEWERIME